MKLNYSLKISTRNPINVTFNHINNFNTLHNEKNESYTPVHSSEHKVIESHFVYLIMLNEKIFSPFVEAFSIIFI